MAIVPSVAFLEVCCENMDHKTNWKKDKVKHSIPQMHSALLCSNEKVHAKWKE